MVKFGSIYYVGNMLIRHLCEYDTDILFTSAFKMVNQLINLYIWISSSLWKCSVKCDIGHIALLFITDNLKIQEALPIAIQSS